MPIFLVLTPYPLLKPTMAIADIILYLDSPELIHHLTLTLQLHNYGFDQLCCPWPVDNGISMPILPTISFPIPRQHNTQQFLLQRTRNPDIQIAGQENLVQDPGPNQSAMLSDQSAPLPDQPVHFLNQPTSFQN